MVTETARTAFTLKVMEQSARANERIQEARMALSAGVTDIDDALFEVQEITEQTRLMARQAAGMAVAPSPVEIPLHQLNTQDTRDLLYMLECCQQIAERVDHQRGRVLPGGVPLAAGESRGTDLAEAVSLLVARLSREVYGPKGRE